MNITVPMNERLNESKAVDFFLYMHVVESQQKTLTHVWEAKYIIGS